MQRNKYWVMRGRNKTKIKKIGGKKTKIGPSRDSNPGPLAPEARIIPLDHLAWLKVAAIFNGHIRRVFKTLSSRELTFLPNLFHPFCIISVRQRLLRDE